MAAAPDGFGPLLVAARREAGLSLEDVASATRLRPHVLADLEAGRVGSSGGPVYARGHLRTLCALLEVDPEPLLRSLQAQTGSAPTPALAELVHPVSLRVGGDLQVPRAAPERRAPRWGTAAAAGVAVLVALVGIGAATGGTPAPAPLALPPDAVASLPAPAPSPAPSPTPAGAALVVTASSGTSWVRVQAGERTLFEGVLVQGSPSRTFTDPAQVRVVVGNGGAVGLRCGPNRLVPAGEVGAVLRFACAPDGLTRS